MGKCVLCVPGCGGKACRVCAEGELDLEYVYRVCMYV